MPARYNPSNVLKLLKQPRLLLGEVNRAGTRANSLFDAIFRSPGPPIIELDWDNLIILDACRAETFEAVNPFNESSAQIRSSGATSWEFMEVNYAGRTLHDTVFVTGNPHTEKLDDSVFHDVKRLYTTSWDGESRTVRPQSVREAATKAAEEYPNKRLIIHFMQPHAPYIGDFGQTIPHLESAPNGRSVWTNLRYGLADVTHANLRKAYRENLEVVLDSVLKLLPKLPGKNVITADHAELLGERISPIPIRGYEHPKGIYHPNLVTVPWLELDGGERKTIESDTPVIDQERSADDVKNQLEALGYR